MQELKILFSSKITGIPVTNVRKKAGRIYSSCIFYQKVQGERVSILAQSVGSGSAQPVAPNIDAFMNYGRS